MQVPSEGPTQMLHSCMWDPSQRSGSSHFPPFSGPQIGPPIDLCADSSLKRDSSDPIKVVKGSLMRKV